jgi:hypothetical protein
METVVYDVPGSARVPASIIYHLGRYIGSLARYVKSFSTWWHNKCARNWHGAPVVKEIVRPVGAEATDTRTQWFQYQAADFYDTVYRSWSHGMTNVSIPVANMLKKSWTLAVSVVINISMLLCLGGVEWDWVCLVHRSLVGVLYQPQTIIGYGAVRRTIPGADNNRLWSIRCTDNYKRKPKY